jgi:hypothetical protein
MIWTSDWRRRRVFSRPPISNISYSGFIDQNVSSMAGARLPASLVNFEILATRVNIAVEWLGSQTLEKLRTCDNYKKSK